MAKVTGIGGVFFRSTDPSATNGWYGKHLGIEPEGDDPAVLLRSSGGEITVWAPFAADTEYFGPPDQPFMINYRVDDLEGMLEQLRGAGVEVDDDTEDTDYGRFGWAVDCDGRRIELWEPPEGG